MARINPADYNLEERLISLNPVAKVHKGGRTRRWSALVVVGDRSKVEAPLAGLGLGPVRTLTVGDVMGPAPKVE